MRVEWASWALAVLALGGCGDPTPAANDAAVGADAAEAGGAAVEARCVYVNAFSRAEECREYPDPRWTPEGVARDCANAMGALTLGACCASTGLLGQCTVRRVGSNDTRISFPGSDAGQCEATARGCTVFARGSFQPMGPCATTTPADGGVAPTGTGVYLPAERVCRAPREGEPPGRGPGGQVCTWSAIAGATEEGRRFDDYASCERVRTQRPYYPARPGAPRGDDPRMRDPAYQRELAWVRSQIEASACVCCHATRTAPGGPSNWYLEAPGNFVDSFFDSGLALGAGWVDSRALGAYPPAENNGFDRVNSGVPSTDPARMRAFFEAELRHRGRTREEFAQAAPFGGPIYDQLVYRPGPCGAGQGQGPDGALVWTGGAARYLYVLEAESASPGVPPNLDVPTGTRWLAEVPPTAAPFASGLRYGVLPTGATQRVPAMGAPAPLAPGATYYLAVLADVGVPVTRCLFTTPR